MATHLSCGRIFSDGLVTNFLLILTVKIFENRLIFGKVKAYKQIVPKFVAHPVDVGQDPTDRRLVYIVCSRK